MQLQTLDLDFQGVPLAIASFLLEGVTEPILIESGPGSTIESLRARLAGRGLAIEDIRHVLVTHIHFDHAGGAGWFASQGAKVYVHPFGAPHIIDPSKLIHSATRIYGDQMGPLWGEIVPAPKDQVVVIEDGDVLQLGGVEIRVIETPGHARHHHAYRIGDLLFTGDAAGIRLPGCPLVDIPAPPPEFDPEAWERSLDKLQAEDASELVLTHFGPCSKVQEHLDTFRTLLKNAAAELKSYVGRPREEALAHYQSFWRKRAEAEGLDEEMIKTFETANPLDMSVTGILRYWTKRAG